MNQQEYARVVKKRDELFEECTLYNNIHYCFGECKMCALGVCLQEQHKLIHQYFYQITIRSKKNESTRI